MAQAYTTNDPVTLAQLANAYRVLSGLFMHLALIKEQQNVNIIVTALELLGDNRVRITFQNPLPVNAAQLTHFGIT